MSEKDWEKIKQAVSKLAKINEHMERAYPPCEIRLPECVVQVFRAIPHVGMEAVNAQLRHARSEALAQLPLMPQPHPISDGATVTFGFET